MPNLAERFRSFLPVIIDLETGGLNSQTDAILELAAIPILMDESGTIYPSETYSYAIEPFSGANIELASLEFTGINIHDPNRGAINEKEAFKNVFKAISALIKDNQCTRAILVGHNGFFDLGFINAAIARQNIKRSPFHPFSCFDTATLAGLAVGHTVLEQACIKANIEFDKQAAHSAAYDAEKTAELFCYIVNKWRDLGGW